LNEDVEMRNFDYRKKWEKLLTPEIVALLTQIHEYKGEQSLFMEAKADTLTQLVEIAKIQSTEASNKIEGIYIEVEGADGNSMLRDYPNTS